MTPPAPSISHPAGMIRKSERSTRLVAALVGAVLTIMAGCVALTRLGDALVSLSYDMPFIVHRPATTDDIRIVYLNKLHEETLDRRPQARLLDRLAELGAKVVLYDVIFDRASLDPATDREFADAIRRFRGVDAKGDPIPGMPQRHVLLGCGRKTFSRTGNTGEQLIPPIDVLLDAADDFGLVAVEDDAYIVRKLTTGTRDEASLIWKAAIAVGAHLGESSRLETRWINFAGPPPKRGQARSNGPIPSFASESVMSEGLKANLFRDKLVVIGGEPGIVGEALGKDLFSTPFHRFPIGDKLALMSGVEVQANGLANLLQHNWLVRSSRHADLWLILISGILLGASLTLVRPVRAILASISLVLLSMAAGVLTIHEANVWFPWSVVAFLQVPVALIWGIAARSYIERFFRIKLTAEQAALRAAFSKYLSPQMLDRVIAQGFEIQLGGEKIQATMMFTDLDAFTGMCERIGDPHRVVQTLNDYFKRTTDSIFDHDGTVIKYLGDSIYAAWGAPLADANASPNAVRAAWRIFTRDRMMVDGMELKTRIGLNHGEVVAGNIGSPRRLDYSLIGDAANLASRLEGLNRLLGTHVLMSEAVYDHVHGEFRARRVGKFRVKGRLEFTVVHELLGPVMDGPEPAWVAPYHQALDALDQQQLALAIELFTAVNEQRGPEGDGPSRFFLTRLQSGEAPAAGVIEIKEK